jgi:hypothetical protein
LQAFGQAALQRVIEGFDVISVLIRDAQASPGWAWPSEATLMLTANQDAHALGVSSGAFAAHERDRIAAVGLQHVPASKANIAMAVIMFFIRQ